MALDLFFVPNHRNYCRPQSRWSRFKDEDLLDSLLMPSFVLDIPRDNGKRVAANVKSDHNKFKVSLDCNHFTPEEIEVKTVDRDVIIHGKHEERMDNHGWVSREFTRKYTLPEECEAEDVKSSLDSNGVLTIEAPKRRVEPMIDNQRVVPIQVIHQTSAVEDNKDTQN
ncbi:unnamed protein product [Medioppia subpectinata]|uniref:SHSP domain-containing protein n=1 Tax=Medioppia subpectinata TaxID=1979941 RepID=A0A7R9L312_9ACAR|nr:unnamed protein product [Medioppia subpectinata]CAG2113460.1 unnamed protein product [Medioppia subpectinata]